MSLTITKTVGVTEQEEGQVHNSWETMKRVEAALAARGIVIPTAPPPFPIPEVTTTLVDTDNAEYLKTNAQYLSWLNYITPNLAMTKGIILEIQNEKTHIEALYRESARRADEIAGRKTPRDEVDDQTRLDRRYMELIQQEQETTQFKYQLEEHKDILERTLRVISRHIEVKRLDVEMNRVNANLPQRRPFIPGRGA